ESAASRLRNGLQQRVVRAVVGKLRLLAIETYFRERPTFIERPNAEQALRIAYTQTPTPCVRRNTRDIQGLAEIAGADHVEIRRRGGVGGMPGQVVIDDELFIRAVIARRRLAFIPVRQQVAEDVGPQLVEARPRQPVRRPPALRVGG